MGAQPSRILLYASGRSFIWSIQAMMNQTWMSLLHWRRATCQRTDSLLPARTVARLSHSWRFVALLPRRRRSAYGGCCSAESLRSTTLLPFWSSDLTLLLPLHLFRNHTSHPHCAGSGSGARVSVCALYYECLCASVFLRVCVCYRPLICMSSIGSYINHTVIQATGHTETLPNQCWVNNSQLQIFFGFSFLLLGSQHTSGWKWGGSGWVHTLLPCSTEVSNYHET